MSTWAASSNSIGQVDTRTIGLQSRQASVIIETEWRSGQKFVVVNARRTCINNAMEPWRRYWRGFVTELQEAGYALRPVQKSKVR